MEDRNKQGMLGQLTPEDRKLWDRFTEDIVPLAGKTRRCHADSELGEEPNPDNPKEPAIREDIRRPGTVRPDFCRQPEPAAELDQKTIKKLARGQADINSRLDLHGLTQSEARSRLLAHLKGAQKNRFRIVLVITGKGSESERECLSEQPARGVLRRNVPHWLNLPEFRNIVSEFSPAHRRHGGSGAFYVRIKRMRGT